MAFIQSNQNEEDEDQQQNQNSGGSGGILSAGSTLTPGGAPAGGQHFATLQNYLKVNKPQGEALASKVAQNFGNVGSTARQGLEDVSNRLKSEVQAQKIDYNPQTVTDAFTAPSQFVKNPVGMAAFNIAKNAKYTGPRSAEENADFQNITANVNSAIQKSQLADTESGRKTLVGEAQKNKGAGITALNQALISTNPNAMGQIQSAKENFAGLQDLLTNKAADLNATIQDVSGTNETAASDVATKGAEKVNSLKKAIEDRLANTSSEIAQKSAAIRNKILMGQPLTDAEYLEIGASGEGQQSINDDIAFLKSAFGYDVDPRQYMSDRGVAANITKEGLSTKEEYADEAALQQLLGDDIDFLPDDDSQAGTADTRADFMYDQQRLGRDLLGITNNQIRDFYQNNKYAIGEYKTPAAHTFAKIMMRNENGLDPQAKQWLDFYKRSNGIDTTPPDPLAPPTDVNDADQRSKFMDIGNGVEHVWWDGSKWTKAPTEFKEENGREYKFNYVTGQYDDNGPADGVAGPIFTAGGGSGTWINPETGEVEGVY